MTPVAIAFQVSTITSLQYRIEKTQILIETEVCKNKNRNGDILVWKQDLEIWPNM